MKNFPNNASIEQLRKAGITYTDAMALRRISMRLHRWHELECGIGTGGVERDETTGKCTWYNSMTGQRSSFRDMETPALKRLGKIMKQYPGFGMYIQGDPRGCALYIMRPGDIPKGEKADAYYTRGIAVYK